ncbi:MAG: HD domain-containing protein [Patescibacteria group bacterium]
MKDRSNEQANLENGPNLYQQRDRETDPEKKEVLEKAIAIAEAVKAEGGMAYIVGGYARDVAMQRMGYDIIPNDVDIEVYGIEPGRLTELLGNFGAANEVGKQFEVIKLKVANEFIDVSLPRRDVKVGPGHKGFKTIPDPSMSVEEASRRRDFTVNAMLLDPLTGEMTDKHGGFTDMKFKVLRAVDRTTFVQDPLRPLRAARFAAQLGFDVEDDTIELCKGVALSELPRERVGEEWMKLLLRSKKPSVGMEAAHELGIIEKLHPELQALEGAEQDPGYHPEGDVWTHTKMTVDAAAASVAGTELTDDEKLIVIFGALCHDLGKPYTKGLGEDGRITHHGHSDAGIPYAKSLLKSMNVPQAIVDRVLPIVAEHMTMLTTTELSDSAVKRLAKRLHPATLEELVAVSKSDSPSGGKLDRDELLRRASDLSVAKEKPKDILQGRDLLPLGFKPGKSMGDALRAVQEAYLDGKVTTKEEAIEFVKKLRG